MRAAQFPSPGACEIVAGETPSPNDGEVLIRVEACGVCGTDAHIYRGEFPARFPLIAGHEFAGTVESIGPGVAHVQPGDPVAVDPNINCGVCRPCRRGFTHLCQDLFAIGVTADGGFATHCLVPARQSHRVPADLPLEVAAMMEPVACCLHGIERAAIRPGAVAVLIGGGMIGLILLQLARLQGVSQAILSEPVPEKRAAAGKLGASRLVDPATENLEQIVMDATEQSGADVVIECVGSEQTAQQALSLAGEGGTVLLFGVAPQSARVEVSPYDVYRREITVTGSFTNPSTNAAALALLAAGRLQVADLISHHLPLAEVRRGIELLEARTATKVMINPQD